jgi:hypothetical protein
MYLVREILRCKPGKVRPMVEKFGVISNALEARGNDPMLLMTDVSGERFWTLVAETKVERFEDFIAAEEELMANEEVRAAMSDYHDLVESGRREVYRIEG